MSVQAKNLNNYRIIKNPKDYTLGEFFSKLENKKLIIPPNQRPYSWEEKEIGDFINDLEQIRLSNSNKNFGDMHNTHYFNMITCNISDENYDYEIQDGQQRTTTVVLFLLYIFKQNKASSKFDEVLDARLTNILFTTEGDFRLVLSRVNNDFLLECVNSNNIGEILELQSETSSNGRIQNAIKCFSDYDNTEMRFDLEKLASSLLDNFLIIQATLADSTSSYKIFELVNNRGRKLDQIDLVKNYFFKTVSGTKGDVKNKLKQLENNWAEIISGFPEDFDHIIVMDWMLFQNKSIYKKYGNSKDIYTSVLNNIENSDINNLKTDNSKGDFVLNFLKSICNENDHKYKTYITKLWHLFKHTKHINDTTFKIMENDIECKINETEMKQIYVLYKYSNFEYIDYFLYYLLKMRFNKDFNIVKEFKKAVSFYVFNAVSMDRETKILDNFNFKLGYYLEHIPKNQFNLNFAFATYYSSGTSDEKIPTNKEIADTLNIEKDTKGSVKILLVLMDELDKILPHTYLDDNYKCLEIEHIVPQHSKSPQFDTSIYSSYYGTSFENSLIIRKTEQIGNKLLLKQKLNINAGCSLPDKITAYYQQHNQYKDTSILLFLHVLSTYFDCPNRILEETQILRKIDTIAEEDRDDFFCQIEKMWRQKISDYYRDNNLLEIDEINEIINSLSRN